VKKRTRLILGGLESNVLRALWDQGETTVGAIVAARPGGRRLHANTVTTVLARMAKRKLVARRDVGGIARWRALVTREEMTRRHLEALRDEYFGGSTKAFAAALSGATKGRDARATKLADLLRFAFVLALVSPAFAQEKPGDAKKPDPPPAAAPPPKLFDGTPQDLAAKRANVALREIGRSRGNRPIEMVSVFGKDAKEDDVDWEALVVAGLEGLRDRDECKLALDVAARLAEKPDAVPPRCAVRFVLDGSPDATAYAKDGRLRTGNDLSTDDDQDGDVDEDGPDDVDGDGRISWMRFPDPTGEFDAAMEKADPAKGKMPKYRLVLEGKDDDGDGLWNEDGPGGVDVARNFTWRFEEHVPACGKWPASEPETRALLDLLLADEKIAVVVELGDAETIAGFPGWNATWTELPAPDVALLKGLAEAFPKVEKTLPHEARAPGPGSLGLAAIHHLGRLWFGRSPLGVGGDATLASRAPAARLTKWRPVSGPGLPPGAELADPDPWPDADVHNLATESQPLADFVALLANARARLEFRGTQTGGAAGVLTLTTKLVDVGRLPTHTQRGADVKGRRPVNVRVKLPPGATLEGGKPLVQIERIAAGAESDALVYVVRGTSGAKVVVEAVGPDTGTVATEAVIP